MFIQPLSQKHHHRSGEQSVHLVLLEIILPKSKSHFPTPGPRCHPLPKQAIFSWQLSRAQFGDPSQRSSGQLQDVTPCRGRLFLRGQLDAGLSSGNWTSRSDLWSATCVDGWLDNRNFLAITVSRNHHAADQSPTSRALRNQ